MTLTRPVPAAIRGSRPVTGFRGDIEGMRAVAVLLVVIYHAGFEPLSGGLIGVDVFFVISGFLITRLLMGELRREGRIRLGEFWARRARRLLPASALVLVAVVAASFMAGDPLGRVDTGRDVTAAAAFLANWWFADQSLDYFAADPSMSPVLHFWSLSVEEQYYLLWPPTLAGLVWGLRRRGLAADAVFRVAATLLVAAAAASFVWALCQTDASPVRAYYGTPARAWELAVGGLVAMATMRGVRLPARLAGHVGWLGLAVIAFAAVTITEQTPFPGTAALAPVLGTAAVILGGATRGAGGPYPFLSSRVPGWIGRLSYSWYLWHWPFLMLAPAILGRPETGPVATLAVVLASLAAAYLTFRLVEDPVRRSPSLAASYRRSLGLGAVLIAVGILAGQLGVRAPLGAGSASGWGTASDAEGRGSGAGSGQGAAGTGESASGRVPLAVRPDPLRAREDTNRIRADRCQSLFDWTEVKQCVYGVADSSRRWVLWGDSHAVAWFPALEANAQRAGAALQVFGKTSCPPSLVALYSRKWGRSYSECTSWRDEVYRQVQSMAPGTIVFLSGMHEYAVEVDGRVLDEASSEAAVGAGMRQVARRLTELGMEVVVIRDTPFPPFEVPACVAANRADTSRCAFERPEEDRGTSWEERTLGDIAGVRFIDLLDEVCGPRRCRAVVDGILRWRDRDHLTATYVETLDEPLGERLRRFGLLAEGGAAEASTSGGA